MRPGVKVVHVNHLTDGRDVDISAGNEAIGILIDIHDVNGTEICRERNRNDRVTKTSRLTFVN